MVSRIVAIIVLHLIVFKSILCKEAKPSVTPSNAELVWTHSTVSIKWKDIHICSGTILDGWHVLTAANCFYDGYGGKYNYLDLKLYACATSLRDHSGQMAGIRTIRFRVEDFSITDSSPYFNCAIVRLDRQIHLDQYCDKPNYLPVKIPTDDEYILPLWKITPAGHTELIFIENLASEPNHMCEREFNIQKYAEMECISIPHYGVRVQCDNIGMGVFYRTENSMILVGIIPSLVDCYAGTGVLPMIPVKQLTSFIKDALATDIRPYKKSMDSDEIKSNGYQIQLNFNLIMIVILIITNCI